jgi:RNA polymerase sigma-70 factor (ECF subfamily)
VIFAALFLATGIRESDRELAERLQRRDTQAMADLYDRFGRLVFSVIYGIVRDTGTAEDLVQETFLRIWNRAAGFDAEKGSLGPWLLTVARNRAIDHIRSAGARNLKNSLELEERDYKAVQTNTELDLQNKDQAKVIRAAMDKLSENQRRVIELAYYEGLSQTEMADKLGEPLGTVKTWVRAALKKLRDELHPSF